MRDLLWISYQRWHLFRFSTWESRDVGKNQIIFYLLQILCVREFVSIFQLKQYYLPVDLILDLHPSVAIGASKGVNGGIDLWVN